MSAKPEHHTRKSYPGPFSALADAERVCLDLVDAICGQEALLVNPGEFEFLARRARALVSAAYRSALENR